MSHILLLAATTGYQTRSLAEACHRHGIQVTIATDRCHVLENPWRDDAIPIRFEHPEESANALASHVSATPIDGIAAVGDRPVLIAALTALHYGIAWHDPKAARYCTNKYAMRGCFASASLLFPPFVRMAVTSNTSAPPSEIGFPCVLKPLGLSGSRGVIRANTSAEFTAAVNRIRAILRQPEIPRLHDESNQWIQVERYIPGREFAVEAIMTLGHLQPLALFDKPDPLEGPFFEETIYLTPSREPAAAQQAMIEATRQAARALGLWHGPIHAELRVNDTGVYVLEIAARPIGGLCSRVLRFRTSDKQEISLEELVVLHAVGRMPSQIHPARPAAGVMMIPVPAAGIFESVTGSETALTIPGIDDVIITVKRGEKLIPLPEAAGYTGFIFASGLKPAFVEEALRDALAALTFNLLPALPVVT